jgi:hypothetical protein
MTTFEEWMAAIEADYPEIRLTRTKNLARHAWFAAAASYNSALASKPLDQAKVAANVEQINRYALPEGVAHLEAENEVLREQNFAMNKTIADHQQAALRWQALLQLDPLDIISAVHDTEYGDEMRIELELATDEFMPKPPPQSHEGSK